MANLRLTTPEIGTVAEAWRLAVKARAPEISSLAKKLGVKRQYLSKILSTSTTIPISTYRAICLELEIDPAEHLTKAKLPWEA